MLFESSATVTVTVCVEKFSVCLCESLRHLVIVDHCEAFVS